MNRSFYMTQNMDEFVPEVHFNRLMKFWWVIVITTLIGGISGYFFHRSHRPVYEASATFYVTIDYAKIPDLHLPVDQTQYNEDLALASTEWVLRSNEVKQAVIDTATVQNIQVDANILDLNSTIERKHAFWALSFRDPDPLTAQTVVNIWAEKGYRAMLALQGSGKIVDFVIFKPPITASLPQSPVIYDRNRLILAGSLIGLIVSIIALEIIIQFPRKSSD